MATQKKTTWEKSSPDLIALFERLVPDDPFVERRKMFGMSCFFANSYLCAGLFQQSMIFRLSEKDLAAFMKMDGSSVFAPMKGRVMKGYGALTDPLQQDAKVLKKWIGKAMDHTMGLPAKVKKPAKRARKAKASR